MADPDVPEVRGILKVCAACDATVTRDRCHRNRYGEYICHACYADGVRFTWNRRLRQLGRRLRKSYGPQLTWAFVLSLAVSLFLLWLNKVLE